MLGNSLLRPRRIPRPFGRHLKPEIPLQRKTVFFIKSFPTVESALPAGCPGVPKKNISFFVKKGLIFWESYDKI